MVRTYEKKFGNPYMRRSRLNEGQFTSIVSGYLALMTPTEADEFIADNISSLSKSWEAEIAPVSRNTINALFNRLDVRIISFFECDLPFNLLIGFEASEVDAKRMELKNFIQKVRTTLRNTVTKEEVIRLNNMLRSERIGFLEDSAFWVCLDQMWKKSSGLSDESLLGLFCRVAFIYYFICENKNMKPNQVSELVLGTLLSNLRGNPL